MGRSLRHAFQRDVRVRHLGRGPPPAFLRQRPSGREAVLLYLGRRAIRIRVRNQGPAPGRKEALAEPARRLRLPRRGLPRPFRGHLLRGDPAAPARAYLDGGDAGYGAASLGFSDSGFERYPDAGSGRLLSAPLPRRGPAPPPERLAHRHLLEPSAG